MKNRNKEPEVKSDEPTELQKLLQERSQLYSDQKLEMDDVRRSYSKKIKKVNDAISQIKNKGIKKEMNKYLKRL